MATIRQELGAFGEDTIQKKFSCPRCKKSKTFKKLVVNFKCADIICDFCGYLAQVKTHKVQDINVIPKRVLGAAWKPQKERMDAGIYFPLYLVLVRDNQFSVFYLPSDLQSEDMFIPREPLSSTAARSG